ncbi:flagellar motor switch protein FliG [Photobacterium phosphoreum]|uniref:Flagellar motor switch protein FliG n=1 Tax=Photobacterium phosphoreum TaxID=659 RepID=A0AAW4ZTK4_PHOPO|nr:flagellar motor switch protein FliG [Photobacterium phosphoreum]MCD9470592.1 flagellar motor switch protein FliG [Photobacterium phosphoreum]MCD9473288.1 flagellar motor switch protein FliG [Photobacterium phosphoreum]MCD9478186.1 flagellar motor switch protein FliG [Photobacterium phosphoreum]MCD9482388.1 flagellar motor switch protein FliG [Photobacterium phosphoreum]MCD9489329.1 flagellar motor switch protein FliG [Photobacterium phosphoreum]
MANDVATVDNKFDIKSLNGAEKAAILLLSLNEQDAASIIRHLDPKQVQRVGGTMASMKNLNQDKVSSVHRLFLEEIQKYTSIGMGSEDFVRNALVAALGEDKANNLVDQILMGSGSRGLDSLKWMDPRQVASIILNEHPQIQTIVLSYLEPEQSAEILSQFPERVRLDLMMRIANLEEVQPAALHELNDIMEKQFAGQAGAQAAKIGGLKAAAEIMNYLDNNVEGLLMDQIRENDEETATQIQDLMFVFDNLIEVDDRGIQILLRDVPQELLQKALKGTDDMLRDKFYSNMSKRASEMLQEDLEAMGPIRVADVEASQKEILSIARRLSDLGELVLTGNGGTDEFL